MAAGGSLVLRWLRRIGLGLIGLVMLLVALGAGFEALARHRARKDFPPPGRLVDIGGRRMHIDCRGRGAPTVILEAGLDTNGSLAWSAVQDRIATVTRTCAYDRAGIMWSDPKPTPQNADAVADDLHATLAAAGEKGPLVMVGHSLGGPYIMDFTRKYGGEVAGLVFVDASHPDQLARFKAINPNLPSALPMTARVMSAMTWIGWTRIPTPDPPLPNIPRRAIAASKAYTATSMPGALAEAAALDQSLRQAGGLRTLGPRPLVVLTATKPFPADTISHLKMSRSAADRYQAEWKAMHDEEAAWSTRSRHQLVPDSSHYIQFERPDIVIAAIDEVVAKVRADGQAKP